MELEERVEALEREMETLKGGIQGMLEEIKESLPDKPAAPLGWQKKAWVLALLNLLVAITLFTNIYMYLPGMAPFALSERLVVWLHAFWVAMAFMWLLLQMYPLALLLEQEDRQWQGMVWRNSVGYFRAHPGLMLGLTAGILVMAVVNSVFPAMWFVVALGLMVMVGSVGLGRLVEGYRKRARAKSE
jgi:hypothetical protein